MIKTIVLSLVLAFMLPGEVYYVTFIKGDVRIQPGGKKLTIGTPITDKDQFLFTSKSDKVSCISPTKGRFDITATKAVQKSPNEWVAIMKDALIPASANLKLSTRSLLTEQTDPEKLFVTDVTDKKVMLIENEPITIENKYPLSSGNFFFIQYTYNGHTVLKKVPNNGQTISFNEDLFTDNAGNKIAIMVVPELFFCFQEVINRTPKSRVLAKFIPVMITKSAFKEQYTLLFHHLKAAKVTDAEIQKEIVKHFTSNYGHIDGYLIEKAIK